MHKIDRNGASEHWEQFGMEKIVKTEQKRQEGKGDTQQEIVHK